MSIEIERKFLVDKEKWHSLSKPVGVLIRQAYLLTEPEKTIRVRTAGEQAFITIKGKTTGISRSEFEYEIPLQDANEIFNSICTATISKMRYKIKYGGKLWDVDEFLDENEGLIIAEIELETESQLFEKPEWLSEEVSGDERYYNAYLSSNSFNTW